MPIIDGKVVRARYTSLKLGEISSVDNPAQPGALASICKRSESGPVVASSGLARAVAKYVGTDDGAHTFQEVLAENKFSEAIWPYTDALTQSIRSTIGDTSISATDRDAKITASVDQFLTAVRQLDPPVAGGQTESEKVERQLLELISKKDDKTMKTVEQLQAEVETLKGQITTLTARAEKAEGDLATETTAKAAAETERDTAKAALATATDETLKVGDREIKKSAVGEDTFAMFKAQEDRAQTAVLEKRADAEFGHVVGTAAEKAAVLKTIEAHPDEATRKAALAILASAEKLAAGGFGRLGGNGQLEPTRKAAIDGFTEKVAEIKKRDSISEADAMRKARIEEPELFEAYQEAANA